MATTMAAMAAMDSENDDILLWNDNATSEAGLPGPAARVIAGASVGGVAALLVLLGVCLFVVILIVKKRRKRGGFILKNPRGKKGIFDDGVANYIYDEHFDQPGFEVMNIKLTGGQPHDYTLPAPPKDNEQKTSIKRIDSNETNRMSYAYDYATTESRTSIRKFDSNKQETSRHSSSRRSGAEKIYMAPAMNEYALYAQIIQIRIEELQRTSIELGEPLGSGNFGTVRQGIMTTSNGVVDVAVKTLKEGSGEEDKVKFLREATIMGQFNHPNVVKLHGIVIESEPILIVLELLPKGDLKNYLMNQRYEPALTVDDHTLLSYCRQVASGMAYLSNKAFVHRDLAARNILLSQQGLCKIADFGLSRDLTDEEYYISQGGKIPVKWTAPEALHYRKYSASSDVWSYGIVMFEIWSIGCKPYEGITINEVIEKVDEGYRLPPPPGCPRAIYEIMIKTWHPLSSERPSFMDIMQQLSLPNTVLLEKLDRDKEVKLGAELSCGEDLYIDLQNIYS